MVFLKRKKVKVKVYTAKTDTIDEVVLKQYKCTNSNGELVLYGNKKAWMTQAVWTAELRRVSQNLAKTVPFCRFRLVCVNAPVQSCIETFDNLDIVFYPLYRRLFFSLFKFVIMARSNENTNENSATFYGPSRTKTIAQ